MNIVIFCVRVYKNARNKTNEKLLGTGNILDTYGWLYEVTNAVEDNKDGVLTLKSNSFSLGDK